MGNRSCDVACMGYNGKYMFYHVTIVMHYNSNSIWMIITLPPWTMGDAFQYTEFFV